MRLTTLMADMKTQQATLDESLKNAKAASDKLGLPQDSDTPDVKKSKQDAQDKTAALQKQRDALPKVAVDQAAAAIHEHSYVIDVLLQGATPGGSTSATSNISLPQKAIP
jgi:hypothetical protein